MAVPHAADLTTDDDAFNNLTSDEIVNQSAWDDVYKTCQYYQHEVCLSPG